MDLLLFWLQVFGSLLLGGFFLYALSIRNQKAAVWYGLAGVVCLVLLFVLQLGKEFFAPAPTDARQVDGPIVTIDRFVFETIPKSGDFPGALELRPVIKNSGRTPAVNAQVSVNLTGRRQLLPADFDYADIEGRQNSYTAILASGQELDILPFKVRADYLERVRRGDAYVFLYGWVEYDDRLTGTKRHRTEFCWRAEVSQDAGQGVLILSQYGPYNCIDKGCRYAPDRPAPKRAGTKTDYLTTIE